KFRNLLIASDASPASARMPRAALPIPAARIAAAPGPLGILSTSVCDMVMLLLPMHENDDASTMDRCVLSQECAERAGNRCRQKCRDGKAQHANAHIPMLDDRAAVFPSDIGHHRHCDRCQPSDVLFPFHSDVVPFRSLAGR